MHAPRQPQFDVVCRVLHYLKCDPGQGILCKPTANMFITCFSDANWAGSRSDRRPTSGYCTFVRSNLATWHSKK